MGMTAEEIIRALELKPHPEGGFYRESYRAGEAIPSSALPDRYEGERAFSTTIYYLLTPETRSRIHRLKSDEIFHFYLGDSVEFVLLFADGGWSREILGASLEYGERPQLVIPGGVWFGARLVQRGAFALMGATVAPGFEFGDYEEGNRDYLLRNYPEAKELILELTE